MIAISHDPDTGTLYWYFTEIIAGSIESEGECDATLLLDEDGQIIGLELELDASVSADDLTLALNHPQVRYNAETYTLTVQVVDLVDPDAQPISEPAILDFDLVGMLQGAEVQPAKTFGLDARLDRLAPLMIDADEDEEEQNPEEAEEQNPEETEEAEEAEKQDSEKTEEAEVAEEQSSEETETAEVTEQQNSEEAEEAEEAEVAENLLPDSDARTLERSNAPTLDADAPTFQRSNVPTFKRSNAHPLIRSGFVALVGKPNVGKSTLLNAILGEKVAITSPKPQTTRLPMRGILNPPGAQIIFVDTPGIHDPRTKLGTFMVDQARRAIPDADIICMVVDITEPPGRLDRKIAELVRKARAPKLLVLNKVDIRMPKGQQHLEAFRELGPWDMELAVSATQAQGLETLVEQLVARLPEGGQLYPETQRTDTNERERAAELVREQVLRQTEQEVPHSVAIEVEEWEDKGTALYIRMSIYVEKDSQKAIIIGAKGARLKEIGSRARTGIERMLGKQVYLDLWAKTRTNWRDDPSSLRWLGYSDKA